MTILDYARWPKLPQYRDDRPFVSHWPPYMGPIFCIAPFVNMQRIRGNFFTPIDVPGSYPRALVRNNVTGWGYEGTVIVQGDDPYVITVNQTTVLNQGQVIYRLRCDVRLVPPISVGNFEVSFPIAGPGVPFPRAPWSERQQMNINFPAGGQFEIWSIQPVSKFHLVDEPFT